MCISKGRPSLLPVVGHSNFTTVWKLHPGTLRFQLSGPLPYDKVSVQCRTKVLNRVNFSVRKSFSKRQSEFSLQFKLQELYEAQTPLLRYVLEQPYSRDMVCNILGLNKQVIQSTITVFLLLFSMLHLPFLFDFLHFSFM